MFEKLSKHPSACEGPVSIRAGDKSGRLIWLDMALSLRDKNVESSILVDVVDITAKKEVALSLCDSEKQLRLLSCQLMDSQEMERKRIAAELHDGLGQLMGAIKYKVEEIMMAASNGFRPLRFDQLEEVVNDISGAMDEVRNISMDLRPSTLDDLGVLLTMEWFCREFQNTYSGIKIKKRIAIEESSISEGRKLVIYRIVQEAMNNVAKYANATVIGLELTERLGEIHLCISDNGQGFNMSRVPRESCAHGFGLRSMRERAEISGGIFSIESAVGEGTGIQVFWPERVSSACQLLD
jgi:signal transduction histidine kinase